MGKSFLAGLILLILVAACTPAVAPDRPDRVSLGEAQRLVREAVLDQTASVNLVESTPAEVWERLGVQTFRLQSDSATPATFLIDQGQVTELGQSFGGPGVIQMEVTDLDANGQPELVYTYSFGSGLHRSHVAVYLPGEEGASRVQAAEAVYLNGDLILAREDDQTVWVQAVAMNSRVAGSTIGRLQLSEGPDGELLFALERSPNLPEEVEADLRDSLELE